MSDYVRVNKFDLIRTLRHYEKTHVVYYRDHNNDLVFVEGLIADQEPTI